MFTLNVFFCMFSRDVILLPQLREQEKLWCLKNFIKYEFPRAALVFSISSKQHEQINLAEKKHSLLFPRAPLTIHQLSMSEKTCLESNYNQIFCQTRNITSNQPSFTSFQTHFQITHQKEGNTSAQQNGVGQYNQISLFQF